MGHVVGWFSNLHVLSHTTRHFQLKYDIIQRWNRIINNKQTQTYQNKWPQSVKTGYLAMSKL